MYKCLICNEIYPNNQLIGYCTCGGDLDVQMKSPLPIVQPVEKKLPTVAQLLDNEILLKKQLDSLRHELYNAFEGLKYYEVKLAQQATIQTELLTENQNWKAAYQLVEAQLKQTQVVLEAIRANEVSLITRWRQADNSTQDWKVAHQLVEAELKQTQVELEKMRANEIILKNRLRLAESPIPVLWEILKNRLKK